MRVGWIAHFGESFGLPNARTADDEQSDARRRLS
jgi:hypothetical protein